MTTNLAKERRSMQTTMSTRPDHAKIRGDIAAFLEARGRTRAAEPAEGQDALEFDRDIFNPLGETLLAAEERLLGLSQAAGGDPRNGGVRIDGMLWLAVPGQVFDFDSPASGLDPADPRSHEDGHRSLAVPAGWVVDLDAAGRS
jgi:hypothetical protein